MVVIAGSQPPAGALAPNPWHAIADLYHAMFTGLIMTLVTRRGSKDAAEFVFRVFRKQHHERFLPGLAKLGIDRLPNPVAAAQYHYLSNFIGGVSVEYMYESDRKAWVRYPPPRWIWKGTAIAAIPSDVSAAMLRGWHAHNGVSLNDPRMGFVCTKQTVDGENSLEGFYYQYDRALTEDERLRFEPGLEAPLFDPAKAPKLPNVDWPQARLDKAYRNYAMEYVRTSLPVMTELFGQEEAARLLRLNGKLIGMQFFSEVAPHFGGETGDFTSLLLAMFEAQGDEASGSKDVVTQKSWAITAAANDGDSSGLSALLGLVEGLAAAYDRRLAIGIDLPLGTDGHLHWLIRYRPPKPSANAQYPA